MSLRSAVGVVRALVMSLGLSLCACDEDSNSSEEASRGTSPTNRPCSEDSQCRSGVCVNGGGYSYHGGGYCSNTCDPSDDRCEKNPSGYDLFCGMASDGRTLCARCGGFGFDCGLDQFPIACDLLDETHCDACGCPDGLRCIPGSGCRPISALGEPCWKDADCESKNCSSFAGVCRVAVGAACTPQDCDLCYLDKDKPGWSFCQKECTAERCPLNYCNREAPEVYQALCHQCATHTFCPAEMPNSSACGVADQFRNYACAEQYVTRATGMACTDSRQCSSKTCLTTHECSGVGTDERCWPVGYCTAACTASSDCPEGTVCAETCVGESCELRCMRSCERFADCPTGHCELVSSAEQTEVHVCDPRARVGEHCTRDSDCQAPHCNRPGTAYARCGNFAVE